MNTENSKKYPFFFQFEFFEFLNLIKVFGFHNLVPNSSDVGCRFGWWATVYVSVSCFRFFFFFITIYFQIFVCVCVILLNWIYRKEK